MVGVEHTGSAAQWCVTVREALFGNNPWVGGILSSQNLKGVTDDRHVCAEVRNV